MVEDLDVFKRAHQLALRTYAVTEEFPREELFSLRDQTRRAAGSVGMKLMEGALRLGTKGIVNSSPSREDRPAKSAINCSLARDLKYISVETYNELRSAMIE